MPLSCDEKRLIRPSAYSSTSNTYPDFARWNARPIGTKPLRRSA